MYTYNFFTGPREENGTRNFIGYEPGKTFRDASCFDDIFSMEMLKKRYRELSKAAHPDRGGGDTVSMQNINQFYELAKKRVLRNPHAVSRNVSFSDSFGW